MKRRHTGYLVIFRRGDVWEKIASTFYFLTLALGVSWGTLFVLNAIFEVGIPREPIAALGVLTMALLFCGMFASRLVRTLRWQEACHVLRSYSPRNTSRTETLRCWELAKRYAPNRQALRRVIETIPRAKKVLIARSALAAHVGRQETDAGISFRPADERG